MPMPVEVEVTFNDGHKKRFYIPVQMMRGEKPVPKSTTILSDWAWAYPTYSFTIKNNSDVQQIIIDPDQKVADINLKNNRLSKEKSEKTER